MCLHGPYPEAQPVGHLFIGKALRDSNEHFTLSRANSLLTRLTLIN